MGLTLANKITIARFLFIPVLIVLIMQYAPGREYLRWWALGLYLFLEMTDVVDGYIARRFRQKTRAGSILDPLADKALFLSTLVCLYLVSHEFSWDVRMPLWLVVAFFARDVFLIAGGLILEVKRGAIEIRPNLYGKMTAFLQVVCVTLVFLQWSAALLLWWFALGLTVISTVIYMKEGIGVLNDDRDH